MSFLGKHCIAASPPDTIQAFRGVTFRAPKPPWYVHMTKRLFFVFTVLLVVALAALAADITGKWVAQVPGRGDQTRETTFNFKVDGDKLTGTMSGRQGETAISDGKITGDSISFVITTERGGETMKWTYTGKVAGDQIQMKREGGQGAAREFTAKRAM